MRDFLKVFKPLAGDFLSTIVFIAIYEITGNIVISTSVGIASGIIQVVWLRARSRKIEIMQWASLALVIVLGSATLLTRDPRFVMVKPSIAAFAIACVMLKPNWQSRYFPPPVKEHAPAALLTAWGYLWAALYFALSAANLFVAYRYGIKGWATFNAFVPAGAPLVLFFIQYFSLRVVIIRAVRSKAAQPQGTIAPVMR
ncbi:MAG TPA: septation protein IspZ [Rhizomicrobium sp.]|jgi:intracellular septation protein A|nr:septation protein IspZ [Rhizomicrobium sp.]